MAAELKPYPSYRDSGVPWLGEVPAHWEVRRLRTIAEMRVSNVDKHSRDGEQPIRLCNYVDVYKADRIRAEMPLMTATAASVEIERFRLRAGDVLITKDSEAWNDIGVPALVEGTEDNTICGYHLALLRPFSGCVRGGFLFRAVQSSAVAYQFHVHANGVTRYGLTHNAIKSVWVPLPPPSEQAAIVRFLDHADRRIRRYIRAKEKLIDLLEEQKQAMVHEAVTGRIDVRTGRPYRNYKDSGAEWLGRMPEHWERRRLKTLLRPVDQRSVDGSETLLSLRRDHGVVRYAEHFSRPSQGDSLVGFKLVVRGQLVVNRLQANNGLIFCSGLDGLVSPEYSVFERTTSVRTRYLSDLLRTDAYRGFFRRQSTGLGTGTAGFLRIYDDDFLATPVVLPSSAEQAALVSFVDRTVADIATTIDRERRQVDLVGAYRTRLIADVVAGRLDVRQAAAELREQDSLAAEGDSGFVRCRDCARNPPGGNGRSDLGRG